MEVVHRICLEVDKCFVVVNVVSSFLYHLLSHTLKFKNCNTKISCKAVLPLGKAYTLLQRYCKPNCLCVATCGLVCNEYPVHKLANILNKELFDGLFFPTVIHELCEIIEIYTYACFLLSKHSVWSCAFGWELIISSIINCHWIYRVICSQLNSFCSICTLCG